MGLKSRQSICMLLATQYCLGDTENLKSGRALRSPVKPLEDSAPVGTLYLLPYMRNTQDGGQGIECSWKERGKENRARKKGVQVVGKDPREADSRR